MKKILYIFLFLTSLGFVNCNSGGSSIIETTTHVWGNCEKCKVTIEKSCNLKGVEKAVWDVDSKLLTVKLDTSVIRMREVLQAVANAGYDNEMFYANDYAYDNLPTCCQYERKVFESK